ncbi:archaetidylserine synthase [Methanococcoides sp. AM1]|uniref:archaetidylserine synthase n=1 Tax=Methanococcoides sp. AM1 TaxID=1201011 RepID=UPI001083A690|nr:archaetidylserine synthase [Methanococcoides sp. AM1]
MMFKALRVPDLVTLGNALFGMMAIFSACSGYADLAFIFIFFAAIADGMDGFLARRMPNSAIGEYLDSLADAISFGVAPAAALYFIYGYSHPYIMAIGACFYLFCGIIRLARFNTKQKSIPDFEGLPITASAVVIASYMLMADRYVQFYGVIAIVLLLSFLMVSEYPYPKLRGAKAMAFVAIVFILPIASYIVLPAYLSIFSTAMFLLLLLYLESPIMRIPRKYYED